MNKPSIVDGIGERLELRKSGKEFCGLCPFHDDRRPSLSVNEEKGVFLCRACGATGDIFDFVMRLDGVSFSDAKQQLGAEGYRPKHRRRDQRAVEIAAWANHQTARANALIREIRDRLRISKALNWSEGVEDFSQEITILTDLAEDLQNVKLIIELYANRAAIENLLADADIAPPPDFFPPLTLDYEERLRRIVRGKGS